jgi:hypothetical protein
VHTHFFSLIKPRLYFSDEEKSRQKLSLTEWSDGCAVAFEGA